MGMNKAMNILQAATTLNVHYTDSEICTDMQGLAQPICRKSNISSYVLAPDATNAPTVNCAKCIAKASA